MRVYAAANTRTLEVQLEATFVPIDTIAQALWLKIICG